MAANSKNKSSKNYALPVIIGIILLIMTALLFARTAYNTNMSRRDTLDLPSVSISMTSKDGESHTVYATFSLDIENGSKKDVSADVANSLIKETISSLDYEDIVSKDGYDLIKKEVSGALQGQFGEKVSGVYITELYQDLKQGNSNEKEPSKYDRVEKFFGK